MIPRKVTRTNHGVACCVCSRVLDIGERFHRELELEAERLRSVVRIAREVDVHLAGHLRSPESDEGRLHAALVALDETEGRDRKIPTASAP